ncbi:hypothetical protein KO489_00435 [Reinekea forsetii]|nr:hypothetical protein [Reinekea forsetii]
MKAVSKLNNNIKEELSFKGVVIATVQKHENGNATVVSIDDSEFNITFTTHSVPALKTGDKVLILNIDNQVILTEKLRLPSEPPAPCLQFMNKTWELNVESEFNLRVGKSSLTISPDGHISIEGKDILIHAQGVNRILGATIELN